MKNYLNIFKLITLTALFALPSGKAMAQFAVTDTIEKPAVL